jgi:hypothetical protein
LPPKAAVLRIGRVDLNGVEIASEIGEGIKALRLLGRIDDSVPVLIYPARGSDPDHANSIERAPGADNAGECRLGYRIAAGIAVQGKVTARSFWVSV